MRCPNGCTGHGICYEGNCMCNPGFGGHDCSLVVQVVPCPANCSSQGNCRYGRCSCFPGFSGFDCSEQVN